MSEFPAAIPGPERDQMTLSLLQDEQIFTQDARTIAHADEAYTGKVMGGWGINSIPLFRNTPFEVEVPTRRAFLTDEKKAMLDEINPDVLRTESFQDFFRHVDMLIAFSDIRLATENRPVWHVYPTREVIQESLGIIIERARNEGRAFSRKVYPRDRAEAAFLEDGINLRVMACLDEAALDPDFRLSKDVVEGIYKDGISGKPAFINHAIMYDERNKMYGESIGLLSKFKEYASDALLGEIKPDKPIFDPRFNNAQIFSEILTYALLRARSKSQIGFILETFAPTVGIEKIRKQLRSYVKDNPSFQERFEEVFEYLGFDPKEPQVDLVRDVYDQIDFSEYSPNQEIQDRDVEILKRELAGKEKVLDVACGTGRHIEALAREDGVSVTGIDIVPKHVELAKAKVPDADIRLGSWFELPFENKSFDAAYCLGRSFTHNTTLPDAVQSLREIRRVIKDDGFIIIDLPDPKTGDYKEMIERVNSLAREKNISISLPGLINDSPDFEHFFDRYIPSDEAFDAIAYLAGLKATKIDSTQYHGKSGNTNVNNYWRLEKFTGLIPNPVKLALLDRIRGFNVQIPNISTFNVI